LVTSFGVDEELYGLAVESHRQVMPFIIGDVLFGDDALGLEGGEDDTEVAGGFFDEEIPVGAGAAGLVGEEDDFGGVCSWRGCGRSIRR